MTLRGWGGSRHCLGWVWYPTAIQRGVCLSLGYTIFLPHIKVDDRDQVQFQRFDVEMVVGLKENPQQVWFIFHFTNRSFWVHFYP